MFNNTASTNRPVPPLSHPVPPLSHADAELSHATTALPHGRDRVTVRLLGVNVASVEWDRDGGGESHPRGPCPSAFSRMALGITSWVTKQASQSR